jgi:hypothetical protein
MEERQAEVTTNTHNHMKVYRFHYNAIYDSGLALVAANDEAEAIAVLSATKEGEMESPGKDGWYLVGTQYGVKATVNKAELLAINLHLS